MQTRAQLLELEAQNYVSSLWVSLNAAAARAAVKGTLTAHGKPPKEQPDFQVRGFQLELQVPYHSWYHHGYPTHNSVYPYPYTSEYAAPALLSGLKTPLTWPGDLETPMLLQLEVTHVCQLGGAPQDLPESGKVCGCAACRP